MDMVIFRTIFFELFSFLHVHAPYPSLRLLTNLGQHQKQDETLLFNGRYNGTPNPKHVLLLLRGPRQRPGLFLHRILSHRHESRNNHRGYHPSIILYNLLSHRQLLALRWARPPLDLHPLQVPPTDLKEIRRAIGSSSHIAQFSKENGGPGHAAANVM